jgi:SAM-dependent methyltransferase
LPGTAPLAIMRGGQRRETTMRVTHPAPGVHPPKPYSESCEENKDPILTVLRRVLTAPGLVLEVGSGTGQHAVHFARHLPHLTWQPTDVPEHLPGIGLWLDEAGLPNVLEPLALDVRQRPWPVQRADAVFSANTAHIMSWPEVQALFLGVGEVLAPGGAFLLYGPFSRHGRHTAESNARFDAFLRARDPASGVRDLDDLQRLAAASGLVLAEDVAMPVNNRTLVWRREGGPGA